MPQPQVDQSQVGGLQWIGGPASPGREGVRERSRSNFPTTGFRRRPWDTLRPRGCNVFGSGSGPNGLSRAGDRAPVRSKPLIERRSCSAMRWHDLRRPGGEIVPPDAYAKRADGHQRPLTSLQDARGCRFHCVVDVLPRANAAALPVPRACKGVRPRLVMEVGNWGCRSTRGVRRRSDYRSLVPRSIGVIRAAETGCNDE